jgi:hypothetical protein
MVLPVVVLAEKLFIINCKRRAGDGQRADVAGGDLQEGAVHEPYDDDDHDVQHHLRGEAIDAEALERRRDDEVSRQLLGEGRWLDGGAGGAPRRCIVGASERHGGSGTAEADHFVGGGAAEERE